MGIRQPNRTENCFEMALARHWPPFDWQDVTIMVAVSGGADSVALLRGLAAIDVPHHKGARIAAHFHHGHRGQEADQDQDFVAELAHGLGWQFVTQRATSQRVLPKLGQEATWRRARYRFLRTAAESHGARFIVTAHTADDQAETILQRILRGTGLTGLSGIPRARVLSPAVTVVRPLLTVSRCDILDYLKGRQQSYRHDATNEDLRFQRNRIRRQLLPQLRQHFGEAVTDNLIRLGRLAGESQAVIDSMTQSHVERCLESETDQTMSLRCSRLPLESDYLAREVLMMLWRRRDWNLRDMGLTQWVELAALAIAPPASEPVVRMMPGSIRVTRVADRLVLTRVAGSDPPIAN